MVPSWFDNPRPPQRPLPRISDHKRYAEAARRDHDDRQRRSTRPYRASGLDDQLWNVVTIVVCCLLLGFALGVPVGRMLGG